ncbi:MAG: FkbM family methyltransferase [Chloroflexi bacterium]|nr:MAG: FkbM family methyltransferase [Chloroflexota bacterium]
MRPPERETQIVLSSGERLWLPGKFASYRNYQLGLYERAVFELLPSIAASGMTVLDIGASVGLYSLTFSRLVGAAGTVFAFEADDEAFSYLRRNIAANARTKQGRRWMLPVSPWMSISPPVSGLRYTSSKWILKEGSGLPFVECGSLASATRT